MSAPEDPPVVTRYLQAVVAGGALAGAATLAYAALRPAGLLDARALLLAAALGVGAHFVLRSLLLFSWRGHRVALAPDEALYFLALVALHPTLAVLFPVPAMVAHQLATRRAFLKGAFNVATVTVAGALGVAVHLGLVASGLPLLLAAGIALIAYTTATHLLVAGVFARRGASSTLRVFRERFVVPTALHVGLGVALGLAVVGLWSFHPLATLALAPFAYFAREHMRLLANTDREVQARSLLARAALDLAGERSVEAAARRVLAACRELFAAGRVTLTVAPDLQHAEATWAATYEDGPDFAKRPLVAALPARAGGTLGMLRVEPTTRTREEYTANDRHLLDVVAGEAASVIEHARALADLEEARAQLDTYLATAGDAVLVVAPDGHVDYANDSGRALFGLRGDLTARQARELFADTGFLARDWVGAEPHLHETIAHGRDERDFPAEVNAAPVMSRGELRGVLAVVRDVTERKEVERARLASRVARPMVKRIVRGLMDETKADRLTLLRLGESLAREVDARHLRAFLDAYAEMGLGDIAEDGATKERFSFVGRELFEHAPGASRTTCDLSLGFLVGSVSRLAGSPARGAEVSCQSRGDARCRFVVQVRERGD